MAILYEYSTPELVRLLGNRFKEYRLRCKLIKRFIFTLENVVHALGHAALLRPALSETERQIRMQKTEKTLKELGPESPAHELV